MLFEEMLKDEFNAGKLEAIKILLSVKGMVSQLLEDKLARVSDEEKQNILLVKAASVSGIEEFETELDKLIASD